LHEKHKKVIRRYNHTSFTVSNLDRSVAFYRGILGFSLLSLAERPREYSEQVTGVKGCSLKIAYLMGYGLTLELIEYLGSSKRRAPSKSNNIGAGHVCFDVDDLRTVIDLLNRNNVDLQGEPIKIPVGTNQGGLVLYALDPDGIVIEFIQPPNEAR
jgi:lactoylglutathione lyase